jgi:D-amino-acid dehydrogenase
MRIAILGAGVVGVTGAYFLQRQGHEVVVVDRQPVAANETSWGNAGMIAPGHSYTWGSPKAPMILLRSLWRDDQALRLKLQADPRMWAWCLRFLRNCTAERARRNTTRKLKLCLYSQEALHEVAAETGIDYHKRDGGALYLYRDQASLDGGAAKMQILVENGMQLQLLDRDGCARIEPALETTKQKIAGGIFAPSDESGDCNLFTRKLADLLASRGVEFRYNTRIERLETTGDRVSRVVTDQGEVKADLYVVSTGVYAPHLVRPLGLSLPIYPVKGYSVTLPIEGSNLAPTHSGVDENNLVAFARFGDRLRLTATAEFAGYDTSHRPSDFATMLKAAKDLFPQGGNYEKPLYWAGLRPMTPENTPIISPTRYGNLFVNAGQGHMGWTMSCGSAKVLADLVAGRRPEIDLAGMTLPGIAQAA